MKKVINLLFAGKSINTSKGELTFDKDGVCVLEDDVADAFKNVSGFTVENDVENNENITDDNDVAQPDNTSENSNNEDDGAEDGTDDDAENEEGKEDDIDLQSLSVPSLKKYAKDRGIDITGLTTKEPIIKAIKEAYQK